MPDEVPTSGERSRLGRWLARPTIRSIKRSLLDMGPVDFAPVDPEMPLAERVVVAGLVIADVFTPSTIGNLYDALRSLPFSKREREQALRHLQQVRASPSGGGYSGFDSISTMSSIRRPDGISGIMWGLRTLAPSITVLFCLFTLEDSDGDLSSFLRHGYTSQAGPTTVRVAGRFGKMRSLNPWSRPRRYSTLPPIVDPIEARRLAFDAMVGTYEDACRRWFAERFNGCIASEGHNALPVMRIMITEESVPFDTRLPYLEASGLAYWPRVWSSEKYGWRMRWGTTPAAPTVFAARRSDLKPAETSTWSAMSRFAMSQYDLVSYWAIACLVAVYSAQIGSLRDRAARRRLPSRVVKYGRQFDHYLLGPGLDLKVLAADLAMLTRDPEHFAGGLPHYAEDLRGRRAKENQPPGDFARLLCDVLQKEVEKVQGTSDALTQAINSSAQLRQSIANTRLQRLVMLLAVLTLGLTVWTALRH